MFIIVEIDSHYNYCRDRLRVFPFFFYNSGNYGFTYRFDYDTCCFMIIKEEEKSLCEEAGFRIFWTLRKLQNVPINSPSEHQVHLYLNVMLQFFCSCILEFTIQVAEERDKVAKAFKKEAKRKEQEARDA